ncbi:MAG TPA: fumarylacetoacetate hydrolase family protein [Pseudoxanthomonas sp.]|nr:fumarylacetoacetate hydrolase family protein [Pseudoxanthomonas sp.]
MFHGRILLLPGMLLSMAFAASSAAGQGGPGLAPMEQAHTFAQVRTDDGIATLLVVGLAEGAVRAVDLSAANGHYGADAFDVIDGFSPAQLDAFARSAPQVRDYPLERLLGAGPRGLMHIAAGTNYPKHGEEVGMPQGAFLFPKLSPAGAPRTKVATAAGVLLDYEVEVCARFDREIRTAGDFDAARKGFFLCGDYTDRATLFRTIDLRNPYSGDGFADAKSGHDRFPAGPFLVVPHDWRRFLSGVRLRTYVDGHLRQDVRAADMIKGLDQIVLEALGSVGKRTWSYRDGRIPMLRRPAIPAGSAVLTGTGDGVVFREPGPEVVGELMRAQGREQQHAIIDRYIAQEDAKGIYLQPGNRVRYESNWLGWIDSEVVAASGPE